MPKALPPAVQCSYSISEVYGTDGNLKTMWSLADLNFDLMKSLKRFEKHSQTLAQKQERRSTRIIGGDDFFQNNLA